MVLANTIETELDDLACRKELLIGNPRSPVAICTLWTQRELVARRLDPDSYFVCANLYSLAGITYMLRNLLALPTIRYVVLCGADQSHTGDALAALFREGVGADGLIPGTRARLDSHISPALLADVRGGVQLLDIRDAGRSIENVVSRIAQTVAGLPALPPYAPPRHIALTDPARAAGDTPLPAETSGFRVERPTVAAAWLDLLALVMRFGTIKPTEYSQSQRELLNVVTVISDENPDDISFPPFLPFSRDQLAEYYPQMLTAAGVPGVSYTYGERLRGHGGIDQIAVMTERLRENHQTRRAVAVTWDVAKDSFSANPPCLTQVAANITNGKLHLTAHFRSHDMFTAWPPNAFALRRMQGDMAAELGLALGVLTIISHSAHIYSDKWAEATDSVASFAPQKLAWREDPRGYFVIRVEGGEISVHHATPDGFTPFAFTGTRAKTLGQQIVLAGLASLPEHLIYLGRELQKAEFALETGRSYVQDKDM